MTGPNAAIVGWVGTVLVLGGYWWSVRRRNAFVFHVANTVGSLGIGWSAIAQRAWPSLAVTIGFGLIGFVGMVRMWRDDADVYRRV